MHNIWYTCLLSLFTCYGCAAYCILWRAGAISDPNVGFQALGVTVDMTSRTMGIRTRRFAMYVDDGEVQFSSILVVFRNVSFSSHDFSKKMYLIYSCQHTVKTKRFQG